VRDRGVARAVAVWQRAARVSVADLTAGAVAADVLPRDAGARHRRVARTRRTRRGFVAASAGLARRSHVARGTAGDARPAVAVAIDRAAAPIIQVRPALAGIVGAASLPGAARTHGAGRRLASLTAAAAAVHLAAATVVEPVAALAR